MSKAKAPAAAAAKSSAAASLPAIGFIGGGAMATALLKGLLGAGCDAASTWVADPDAKALERLRHDTGVHVTTSNAEAAKHTDVLILCVKPQYACAVVAALGAANALDARHLVLSVAAGVTTASLRAALPAHLRGDGGVRLVRAMPNTPALVGAGASGFAFPKPSGGAQSSTALTQSGMDRAVVRTILSAVGPASAVFELSDEKLLDAVTGLSGSGPAYVFLVIEALADGGVSQGLTRDTALALAAQTVLGSAQMLTAEHQKPGGVSAATHPAVLRDRVTSPGGTTIAGLRELEAGAVRSAIIKCVAAATHRAHELSLPPLPSKL